MSDRVKHFVIGALILLGAGILFIPVWFDKISFSAKQPLEMPKKSALSGPMPFLTDSDSEAKKIDQAITAQRQLSLTDTTSHTMPTPAWTFAWAVMAPGSHRLSVVL